jgi:hypothetical protein
MKRANRIEALVRKVIGSELIEHARHRFLSEISQPNDLCRSIAYSNSLCQSNLHRKYTLNIFAIKFDKSKWAPRKTSAVA